MASDTLDRVVWESLFPFFNFAVGGPLEFHSTLATNDENKHKTNGIIPVTKVNYPWEGVCPNEDQAHKIENAINWLITTLIQYPGELGLAKYPKDYMTVLTQPVTSPEPYTTTRNKNHPNSKKNVVSSKAIK